MSINIENMNEAEIAENKETVLTEAEKAEIFYMENNKKEAETEVSDVKEEKNIKSHAEKASDSIGASKKVENIFFGNIGGKIRMSARVLLGVFVALGLCGVVLTVLLTSSLGVLGVFMALAVVGIFVFTGYVLSVLIYGFAGVVEKSPEKKVEYHKATEVETCMTAEEKPTVKHQYDEEEFPEF